MLVASDHVLGALGGGEVAVLVEDLGHLPHLGSERALGLDALGASTDPLVATTGEDAIDHRRILIVEIAEQLVGERAVRLREEGVGQIGHPVREARPAVLAGAAGIFGRLHQALVDQRVVGSIWGREPVPDVARDASGTVRR